MKSQKLIGLLLLGATLQCAHPNGTYAQAPAVQWQKSLGGTDYDAATCIDQAIGGGYFVGGSTPSTDGDVHNAHGAAGDIWVLKLTATGDTVWTKTLGGTGNEGASAIAATNDGGCIVAGSTISTDGDVHNNHGGRDMWIVKLTAIGDTVWTKTLGGTDNEGASAIAATNDGGCIVAGTTYSTDGDVHGGHVEPDMWIVKLTATGDTVWTKTLGGTDYEEAVAIAATNDGGYIVAGNTLSIDGNQDMWIVKLTATGDTVWTKTLGGTGYETATGMANINNGGCIVAGYAKSTDGDVHGNHGLEDIWVVKRTATGDTVWTKTLGGSGYDRAYAIAATSNGGCVVAVEYGGLSQIRGVVKLTTAGDSAWTKTLDGYAYGITTTNDGGFAAAGYAGNAVPDNHGSSDFWVVKLAPDPDRVPEVHSAAQAAVYPNPALDVLYLKSPIPVSVSLLSMEGQEILHQSNAEVVNVRGLAAGVYMLRITDANGQLLKVERVVKQ
jgi:hypothetical protein